ncbi:protein FAM32A-like [Punica granatum]|uniref:Protein FAM32A-like n=2 Tax=Punica granatum TaxID=22663 RepID=A0A6P8BXK1_PUNGR|nr:protein FAM32A-like [Punica granatum]XP_031376766.1 protein FAM32A-like [Punica granatum]OWM81919.1 hypothetical protein CDL15_Pgr007958 [Punica granatum]PKI52689.1 hypothetical protein CRG98_026925 [Punica granatum]
MSAYENVVGSKLKLKGKALDVKAGGVKKKTKKKKDKDKHHPDDDDGGAGSYEGEISKITENDLLAVVAAPDDNAELSVEPEEDGKGAEKSSGEGKAAAPHDDHLTPAERRYIEQRERIDVKRLAKTANKSHRDRIQDFNQYLANMSEHYDIPKVGPG